MNAPQHTSQKIEANQEELGRLNVLHRFQLEDIRHLGQVHLLLAQGLAGHGEVWGKWHTPKSLSPGSIKPHYRAIDLAQRIRYFLAKNPAIKVDSLQTLIDEGVVVLTRLALITRLAGTGGTGHGKTQRLKPSTIASLLYKYWPEITARAIHRKASNLDRAGVFSCLTEEDILVFNASKRRRIELIRLNTLVSRGLWADVPSLPSINRTTNPSGARPLRSLQEKSVPYPPIPDDYMAAIGPRILWIVQDMGPHLLLLLEAFPLFLQTVDWTLSKTAIATLIKDFIATHLQQNPWRDSVGKQLTPPFPLITTGSGRGHRADKLEWPPRTLEQITILSISLQAAHLFVTLLASAGRIGEIATLERDCVVTRRDNKHYLGGYTYKLSGNLFGDARQWPAPDVLCQCLGQQMRLATAWDWLPKSLEEGPPQAPRFGSALWVSISVTGFAGAESSQVAINHALMSLAKRTGMSPMPGGKNLHAHRFRKTIGRLAGVALFNSPLVLKRLFGHKSIEMTLHYILSDPGIREDAEKVLLELRIMHCAEALEEIHYAMQNGLPLPGNGGSGAARLVSAVANEEKHLEHSGRVWAEGSAYDLAYLLTAQGRGWRLIKENIVCSKAPGEDGLCLKKRSKGEPNTANCQSECHNRIVLMHQRRDTEVIIEQYIDIARKAREEGQLLVLASVIDNLRDELENFLDLKEKYNADPEVQSLFALCEETSISESIS